MHANRPSQLPLARLLWVLLFISSACARGPASDDGRLAPIAELRDLPGRWTRIMDELNVPGLGVAVVRDDKVVLLEGLGIRDPMSREPVTPDTVFYIASSTKSFVALGIMILAEEGRIELDAPVRTYLSRFQLADPQATSTLTIRDLLSHAKGLESGLITIGEAYTGLMSDEKFYRLLRTVKPRGTFVYSNLHFTLLGRVIEAVSGMTWKEFVTRRILAPLSMENTFCNAGSMFAQPDVAKPIEEIDGSWQVAALLKSDSTMHAAGGMGASARDLATWIRLNLGGGAVDGVRILSPENIKQMQTQQTEVGKTFYEFGREGYGLGWYTGSYQGNRLIHHFGSFPGSRAHVSFMPEHGIGVAVVVNQAAPAFYLADMVACEVYDRLLKLDVEDHLPKLRTMTARFRSKMSRSLPTPGPGPTKGKGLSLEPTGYVGKYTHEDWGALDLRYEDNELVMRLGNVHPKLVSAGTDRFSTMILPRTAATGRFEIKDKKRVTAVALHINGEDVRFERR